MKNKKNVIITFIIIVLFIIILLLFLKKNIFKKVPLYQEIKTVNNIEFSKVNVLKKDNEYIFIVTVKNNSSKDITSEGFDVTIINENGKTIDTLSGYIGGLNKGEAKEIEITSKKDLKKIYDVKYKVY